MDKIIVINLGNKGVLISLKKENNKILDKLFIDSFSQETLPQVSEFFAKYKKYDAYIVLDTVAQNYNYKIFPPLSYLDLQKIVARRFNSEIPKHDLKRKKFLYKNTIDKRSIYLFISASVDSPLREWFNFFNTIPNNLLGVYLLPFEAVEFAKKIIVSAGIKNKITEKNGWILITFNDQTSDLRQVAIFNNNIAFTRLISLESATENNLAEFAKNDIIRTSEYIKRFDNEFSFDKLTIITILEEAYRDRMREFKMDRTIFLNYTPYEIAKDLKLGRFVEPDEKYADLLLSSFIFKNPKRVRFENRKISFSHNITTSLNIIKKVSIIFILLIAMFILMYTFIGSIYNREITNINEALNKNKQLLYSKSKEEYGMDTNALNKIIDAVNIRNLLVKKYYNPVDSMLRFYDAENNIALVSNITWRIDNFDYQKSVPNYVLKTVYSVDIVNPDGDPNKLFARYDAFNSRLKDIFKEELTNITALPSNINFSEKYTSYPIKVEITERK